MHISYMYCIDSYKKLHRHFLIYPSLVHPLLSFPPFSLSLSLPFLLVFHQQCFGLCVFNKPFRTITIVFPFTRHDMLVSTIRWKQKQVNSLSFYTGVSACIILVYAIWSRITLHDFSHVIVVTHFFFFVLLNEGKNNTRTTAFASTTNALIARPLGSFNNRFRKGNIARKFGIETNKKW